MLGELADGTVGAVKEINRLVRFCHETAYVPIVIKPLQDPVMVCWHDAAWGVRRDGKSQAGLIVGMSDRALLSGDRAPVNVLMAQSKRVPRVCRSSFACETQSAPMALEEM